MCGRGGQGIQLRTKEVSMSGVSYIVNEKGEKTAVVIDLTTNADIWEDFYDVLLAKERENEPLESYNEVMKLLSGSKE